ncbi:hypothetical protein FRC18_010855 [Serendipita sp. 400]|nr:hypothetical protein FRC18_010855 [Serendipita sp. 400]
MCEPVTASTLNSFRILVSDHIRRSSQDGVRMDIESEQHTQEPAEPVVQQSASPTPATSQSPPAAGAVSPSTSTRSLKRSADIMQDDDEERQDAKRKRLSADGAEGAGETSTASTSQVVPPSDGTDADKLVEEIGLELGCGCCAALCYNPVLLLPCQHYYCGSCYTLWTRNGGVNCPSCRSAVASIVPSRAIQSLIEIYLRSVPSRARIQKEKEQADEIYTAGQTIPVPTPRPRSPEIAPITDHEAYFRPCPHCASPNDFNWSCPDPIIDPSVDLTRARLLTDGVPPGHARCGNCEHLHAARAPPTSRCDFCHLTFCGLVVPTRCHAKRIRDQKPIGMDNLMDILGNSDVYDAFNINAVEFDYMLDYLREHDITPENIYSEIVETILTTNDGWRPLLDRGLFPAVTENPVPASDPPADPPRENANVTEEPTASSTAQSPETAVEPPAQEPSGGGERVEPVDQEMRDRDQPAINVPEEGVPPATMVVEPTTTVAVEPTPTVAPEPTTMEPEPTATMAVEPAPTTETASPPTNQGVDNTRTPGSADTVAAEAPDLPEGNIASSTSAHNSTQQPPTPIIVPEPLPTPNIEHPEPTLDALPIDVEPQEQRQQQNPEVTTESQNQGEQQAAPPDVSTISQPPNITSQPDDVRSNSSSDSDDGDDSRSRRRSSPPPENSASPNGPHLSKICRKCAAEVFFWGARDWWIKERAKAVASNELAEDIRKRKDCENIGACEREFDNSHAREFNHIPQPLHPITIPNETPSSSNQAENGQNQANPVETSNEVNGSTSNPPTSATEAVEGSHHSPERPSSPDTVRMEVEPTQPVSTETTIPSAANAPSTNGVTTESAPETPQADHQMETDNHTTPVLSTTSHDVLQTPSGTMETPASTTAAAIAPVSPTAMPHIPNGNGYSEKIDPSMAPQDLDVQMTIHEESSAPTAVATTTARVA